MLIITSFYLTCLNKHTTFDLSAEERIVSHSRHETTVRRPDLTDGWGMPKLSPSPGDHQRSLSAASSWGSNYLISGCPRFPGHSPDPQRPPSNGRPKAWGGLHLSIRPITDFSGARDGHMLGIRHMEFSTTKLWRVSQLEIIANQQWKELDYTVAAGLMRCRYHVSMLTQDTLKWNYVIFAKQRPLQLQRTI